jgi:hypothetical protein
LTSIAEQLQYNFVLIKELVRGRSQIDACHSDFAKQGCR